MVGVVGCCGECGVDCVGWVDVTFRLRAWVVVMGRGLCFDGCWGMCGVGLRFLLVCEVNRSGGVLVCDEKRENVVDVVTVCGFDVVFVWVCGCVGDWDGDWSVVGDGVVSV